MSTIAGSADTGRHVLDWVVGVLVVGAVAVVAALAVGLTSHQEGEFAALGAFLAAVVVGAAVAALGWMVLLVVVVRRHVPRGRRLAAGCSAVGAVLVGAALGFGGAHGLGGHDAVGPIAWAGIAAFHVGAIVPPIVVWAYRRGAVTVAGAS